MIEELDNSLIPVHQNIKGLSSKISEFISLLTLDNINPQFLCFSEHHMSESNLCIINTENYNLGTSFCHHIHQKGCLYMLGKMYVTKALISQGIVKKKFRNMFYTNRICD